MMKVWTERQVGAWEKCTECSYLMTMHYGGHTNFPLGVYTDEERDAFDATFGTPNDIGSTFDACDQGAMVRYGVALRTVPRSSLSDRLQMPGRALAIAGSYSRLPKGHYLRRWQPAFIGGHATTVEVHDNGILWLDPLAVKDHPGDKVDAATVLAFASGWSGWNPREALFNELIPQEVNMPTDWSGTKFQDAKIVRLRQGAPVYDDEFGQHLQGNLLEDTDVFFPGFTLVQPGAAAMHLVRRLDRLGTPVWIYQDAIMTEVPFRRYTLNPTKLEDVTPHLEQAAAGIAAAQKALKED